MKYLHLILFIAVISFFGCSKESPGQKCETLVEGHLIFGTYYGECLGNCAFLYKIENCLLYEDDMESYYTDDLSFNSDPLSQEDYELALDAEAMFPADLWNETDSVFGIPDAYDQGGIYIEKNNAGTIRKWHLDTNEEAIPEYLREYAALIKNLVLSLEE